MADRWEQLAQLDPLFVIVAEEGKDHGGWDPEEFFRTGEAEVAGALERFQALGGSLAPGGAALDFGCGVGRLTLPLAERTAHATGADISPRMIELAREYAAGRDDVTYVVNQAPNLACFPDDSFDLVFTTKVIYHLKPALQECFLREFMRVLKPGGAAIFEASVFKPATSRWQGFHARYKLARRRLLPRRMRYSAMRALGFKPETIYERFGWRPKMAMYTVDEARLQGVLDAAGAETLGVDRETRRHRMNATWFVRAGGASMERDH